MLLPPLPESPPLIALLAAAAFAAAWAAMSSLIAAVSGWRRLARVYRLTTPFNGRQWRFRSHDRHAPTPLPSPTDPGLLSRRRLVCGQSRGL